MPLANRWLLTVRPFGFASEAKADGGPVLIWFPKLSVKMSIETSDLHRNGQAGKRVA
jgi:hypothetical protein